MTPIAPRRTPSGRSAWNGPVLAVLNILVAVGLTIAVGGWLLRGRAAAQRPPGAPSDLPMLMLSLIVLAVASYLVRRLARRYAATTKPGRRQALFYWSHV